MKKQLAYLAFFILIVFTATACGASEVQEAPPPPDVERSAAQDGIMIEAAAPEMEAITYEDTTVSSEAASSGGIDRLIIRNGSINMQVEDTYQTRNEIKSLVNQLSDNGAFILSANEYAGAENRDPQIEIVIRVPADAFDTVMEQLAGMAVVVNNREEYSQDVTEEYNDIENRLDSLEAARQRLLEIMENADTTEDLLQAEQQLTERETEIESLKGRQKYLSESARLSRITIFLQPYLLSQPIDTGWKPLETMREALDDLINGMKNFINSLLYFIIAVAPWLALFGYLGWKTIKFIQKKTKKSEEKSE